jgi:hypothetical protein
MNLLHSSVIFTVKDKHYHSTLKLLNYSNQSHHSVCSILLVWQHTVDTFELMFFSCTTGFIILPPFLNIIVAVDFLSYI